MRKLDTHYYDGKLPIKDEKIKDVISTYTDDELRSIIKSLRYKIESKPRSGNSLFYFDAIVRDAHGSPNFDPINHLYANELLYIIAIYSDSIDTLLLIEQLNDMKSGFCPQGRTTRLYQIIQHLSLSGNANI